MDGAPHGDATGGGRTAAAARDGRDDWQDAVRRLRRLRRLQLGVPVAVLVLIAAGIALAGLQVRSAQSRQADAERSLELTARTNAVANDAFIAFWQARAAGGSGLSLTMLPAIAQIEGATAELARIETREGDGEDLAILAGVERTIAEGKPVVARAVRTGRLPPGWQGMAGRWISSLRDGYARLAGLNAQEVTAARQDLTSAATRWGLAVLGLTVLLIVAAVLSWRAIGRHTDRILLALRRGDRRARGLAEHASDLVLVVEPGGEVTYASPSARRALDVSGAAPRMADLSHPEDRGRLLAFTPDVTPPGRTSGPAEIRLRGRDGTWAPVEGFVTNACAEPAIGGFILNGRDVSERKALEDFLTHQAFHDALTGLANRALLMDRLDHALRAGARHGTSTAVLLIDLDDFKTVNDSLGHGAGDRLLVALTDRLEGCLRVEDTAARLGGDEFAVVAEGVAGRDEAEALARRIIGALAMPVQLDGRSLVIGLSIGISLAAGGQGDARGLLRDADAALYAAKGDGKGRHRVFEPGMHHAAERRLGLVNDLHRALENGELELEYQPIMALGDGHVAGAEALARWHHPRRGLIMPGEFIPLAEETGLIVPIGRWALMSACATAAGWPVPPGGGPAAYVTVNVSARQMDAPGLVADVREALRSSGLDPGRLVLEVTESCLARHFERASAMLTKLRELGVRVAIDDFGTGYSSLAQLVRIPVDLVKIDRSLVRNLTEAGGNRGLAAAIVGIGDALGLAAVAEGVEDPDQLSELQAVGCALGQGFLWSRPVRAELIPGILAGAAPVAALR